MSARYLIAAAGAAAVTLGLFLLMQSLISMPGSGLDDSLRSRVIEFVRLKKDSDLELKKREVPDREKPEPQPPPPPLQMDRIARPDQQLGGSGVAAISIPELELVGGTNLGDSPSDADVVPLVRVQPVYPSRALAMGLEGWVEVEFTISPSGTVVDPVVVQSSSGMFHTATLRAIRKWKYNPKIVDGKPVARPGVRVQLNYALEDER